VIVREIMTTHLVTVAPDDTLAHAATLFRQHQFHHLPVVRKKMITTTQGEQQVNKTLLLLEGILTAQDIDLVDAISYQDKSGAAHIRPWQERIVAEVMHRAIMRVTPTTTVSAAAQMLVERNLNYLPVVEYNEEEGEHQAILVGLVTRSDLLIALSRAMGAFAPGMQLDIMLPLGDVSPLARTLQIAVELHIPVRSVMAVPFKNGVPHVASLRLGTINPTPLLRRLQEEGIASSSRSPLTDDPVPGEW
jgi:acetoin utilization protein AcuB